VEKKDEKANAKMKEYADAKVRATPSELLSVIWYWRTKERGTSFLFLNH